MPLVPTDAAKSRPRVTVLTAAWNALDDLKRTVESVRAQSFRDLEHVVIDGGSTDGTREWLESLGDEVRWVSAPDDGIADALNKGLAMARGEYVLVLQAEDTFVDAASLERAAAYLEGGPDILAFDILFEQNSVIRRLSTPNPALRINFKPLHHQGVLCRRTLFEKFGGFDPSFKVYMDYDFLSRSVLGGASVVHVPKLLSRMPGTGVSSRRDWPSLRARFAEERRIHMKHCPSPWMRAVYAVYWPLYLAYRRLRALLGGRSAC